MKKIVLGIFAALMIMTAPVFAVPVTVPGYPTVDVPADIARLVNENMDTISKALHDHTVSEADFTKYVNKATEALNKLDIKNPYSTAMDGLNGFCDGLKDTVPNTQIQQNVWANSWIGHLVQVGNGKFCPRFGFGVNLGAAKMDLTPLKDMSNAFKMDLGSVPNQLALPTITFDARLGGVKVNDFELPFDIGFTLCTLDSSKMFGLDKLIKPVYFDLFSIGFDVRYCLWKPKVLDTKFIVGAGFYYTSGKIGSNDGDNVSANLDYKSTNFTLNTQISTKLLFFRPFAGFRLMFTNSKVEWGVRNLDWTKILNDDNQTIQDAISNGLFPRSFGGTAEGFKVRPVVQGGFAFDFAVIDLTFSGSYDLGSNIWGGAFSLRFSL